MSSYSNEYPVMGLRFSDYSLTNPTDGSQWFENFTGKFKQYTSTTTVIPWADVQKAGLLLHYTMENIVSTLLVDETGNLNGVITGATQVPTILGNSLRFREPVAADHVRVDTTEMDIVSISLKFIPNTAYQGWRGLIGLSDNTVGNTNRVILMADCNDLTHKLRLYDLNTKSPLVADAPWVAGTTYSVLLEFDGVNTVMYINNIKQLGFIATNVFKRFPIKTVIVGSYSYDNNAALSCGCDIDEVRIYNRRLTADERDSIHTVTAKPDYEVVEDAVIDL